MGGTTAQKNPYSSGNQIWINNKYGDFPCQGKEGNEKAKLSRAGITSLQNKKKI